MKTKILTLAFAFFAISLQAQQVIPMPKPGPAPTINIGKPNEFKLENGLTVIVVENHKLPRVSATLTIDNPPFALGAKKGTESLLSEMLGTGTKNISKEEFNERIEFLGANVRLWESGASASSLKKYFTEVFGFMADGALNPNFTEAEFEAVKARYIEGLKSDEKSVESAAARVRDILIYGKNHPFAEYDTQEQIEKITLADVQEYYNKYYKPNNAYLIVVGDITTKEVKKLSKKLFKNWKAGDLNIPALPAVAEVKKTQVDIIDMPNAVQSVVGLGYPVNLTKNDPDYYAVQVASSILGGDFNSKLNMNLREANGWTYGARGGVNDSRYVGTFTTNATVRNDVTDGAVKETLKEVRSMTTDKIDAKQLEDVKAKFLGNFILTLERPQTIANQALTTKTNKLSPSFYSDYIKNINAVTVDDVLRVSKKYFRPDQAKIIVTGKAEQIGDGLEALGYPVTYYDKYGNKTAKPAPSAKKSDKTVQQVTDAYIAAVGGKEKVAKISTLKQSGAVEIQGMKGEYVNYAKTPNKTSVVMKIMGMEIVQTFDGEKAFAKQGANKAEVTDGLPQLKITNTLFLPLSEGYKSAEIQGEVTENGKKYTKVYVKDLRRTDYYDVATGLLAKSEITQDTPMGQMNMVTTFDAYKEFEGVKFPTILSNEVGPQKVNVTVDKVEVNKNVSDADFK
ncbi:MAG: insulinase family protein [Weeksellaceae bacterium]|nr:insulinase family protein [Weeksellaceae bacterium]